MRLKSRSEPPARQAERRSLLKALRQVHFRVGTHVRGGHFAQDYGHRSRNETLLAEVVPALIMAGGALRNLRAWMRPERRGRSIEFWPARNQVHQPAQGRRADHLALELSPAAYRRTAGAAALAAGNRIIVKPSELTPATSALLKQRLEEGLGSDRVTVALGGRKSPRASARLPFDHILFTGSTQRSARPGDGGGRTESGAGHPGARRQVAGASSFRLQSARAVERIVRGKLLNAGQTVHRADYALVARGKIDDSPCAGSERRPALLSRAFSTIHDYTAIINSRHYDAGWNA